MQLSGFLVPIILIMTQTAVAQLVYPQTKKIDQTDNYHGTIIADPYRWLENDTSSETKAWVKEQNQVTFSYLEKIPFREQMKNRIREVFNYPKYSIPFRNQDYYYFSKNDGLQNQSVLYRQKGLSGKPEVVIDPNELSKESTTVLSAFALSKSGDYAAWGISKGGSDWQTFFVRDMKTGKDLPDTLNWVKVSGIAWQGDGFYYSRYPGPESGMELSSKNENHQVWFHKVNTSQSEDRLVFENKSTPQAFHTLRTSEDEQFAFLTVSDRAKGFDGNALFLMKKGERSFRPIVEVVGEHDYSVLEVDGNRIFIFTDDGAPNKRIVEVDANNPQKAYWKTLIAETTENIEDVAVGGKRIIVNYLKDVSSVVYEFDYSGKRIRQIELPAPGMANGFDGKNDDKFLFYSFSTFNYPPTIFRYDIASGKSTLFRKPELSFDPADFEVKQVFYPSKDSTQIPMFLVYKNGLKLDGSNPTMLYAYGGFNVSSLPSFTATLIPWLEQGGVFALANIRGGAEYGESWHQAGMRFKKQNVFDDFIAAAEYLIGSKYTRPAKLAIRGGSNGGLLVGAVINQRPELFKVAIPQVGVMDMLRFHKFTIGYNWIAEYGSSEKPEEFKNLYAYSPIHNLKKGVHYPATMITTADHDDRVVPAHSFKYAATLQEMHAGENPVLIRIDTNSGHGSSNTSKAIETMADIYSFALYNMNVNPVFKNVSGKKSF